MSNFAQSAAGGLLICAKRALPDRRKAWAEAMAAEAEWIGEDRAAVSFAAGCLQAGCSERVRAVLDDNAPWWAAGVLASSLLFAHALVPASGAWPLLWTLAGGALAVACMRRAGRLGGLGHAVTTGLKAGLLGAVLFVAAAALVLLGEPGSGEPIWIRIGPFAVAAVLGAAFSTLGGLVAAPFACPNPKRDPAGSEAGR